MIKKIIKVIGGIIAVLLLLPLIAFLFLWTKNQIFLEGVEHENLVYLTQNKYTIDRAMAAFPEVEPFDTEFYNNHVFLLGENHGYADAQLLDKYLLMHLNKKVGLRYYLAEMDSSRAAKLNDFLSKDIKDASLLKQVIRDIAIRIPQQSSEELYQKWSDIYDYNRNLQDSLKFIVVGLDTNFDDDSTSISRDSVMLLNFSKFVESKNLQHEKFYGFFGYTHVLQSGYGEKNVYPFAGKIKRSNLPFSKEVQSIVCLTLDSEMNMPKNNQYPSPPDEKTSLFNLDGPFVLSKGIKDLKEVTTENTITLFNLNKIDSPYRNNQKLASMKVNLFGDDLIPNNVNQKTTDFFQYVVLIRNSKALTKLSLD
jgi:hypothetical protein